MGNALDNIPEVNFIDDLSLEELQNQMVRDYQDRYKEITGNETELARADPYRLILYACSLQQYQAMQFVNIQGKMNLLKYSTGAFLDQIAALRGLSRNQGTKAITKIKFCMESPRSSITTITEGTRLAAGTVFFLTKKVVEIPAGDTETEIEAECSETGTVGNGFLPGEIRDIVDSLPYIAKAENTTASDHGTEIEDDDNFAERIYLSPSQYSVAGPIDAYIYFAKTYSPLIEDVRVTSPHPTEVDVRFVLTGGKMPDDEIINGLQEFLNGKDKRPLTDKVTVSAPNTAEYNVNIKYFVNGSDKGVATTIQKQAEEAVEAYRIWQDTKIGRDINPSYFAHLMVTAGAKRVEIAEPAYTKIADTDLPQCRNINVVYGGIEND